MHQVEGVRKDKRDAHASHGSSLRPNEEIKATVLVLAVGHQEMLEPVVECHFKHDLDPLLVDGGHHSTPKGPLALRLHDPRDKAASGLGQFVLVG